MKQYITLLELSDLQTAMKIHQDLFRAGIYAFLEYAGGENGELTIRIRVRKADRNHAAPIAKAA